MIQVNDTPKFLHLIGRNHRLSFYSCCPAAVPALSFESCGENNTTAIHCVTRTADLCVEP